jgi:hypothetical protein
MEKLVAIEALSEKHFRESQTAWREILAEQAELERMCQLAALEQNSKSMLNAAQYAQIHRWDCGRDHDRRNTPACVDCKTCSTAHTAKQVRIASVIQRSGDPCALKPNPSVSCAARRSFSKMRTNWLTLCTSCTTRTLMLCMKPPTQKRRRLLKAIHYGPGKLLYKHSKCYRARDSASRRVLQEWQHRGNARRHIGVMLPKHQR